MRSCFIAENGGMVDRVYPPQTRAAIHRDLGPLGERVYRKADVMAHPELFAEVAYIFSTWSMPAFSEEEIRACFPRLKGVFYGAGSVQSFARPFLNCGVEVFSAWAANAIPVAETALSLILLANTGYHMPPPTAHGGLTCGERPGNMWRRTGAITDVR